MWRSFGLAPHSPLALKRCATEGSPISVPDSPSQPSQRSSGRSHPSPMALRKARTMRDLGEPDRAGNVRGTPRARRKPRYREPVGPVRDSSSGELACPPSPSPQRQPLLPLPKLLQSPSSRRTRPPLSPKTPSRASNRHHGRLPFSPSPARVLTYGILGKEADAESLPTPPPSSPVGPSKRRRLTALPVPLLSPRVPEGRMLEFGAVEPPATAEAGLALPVSEPLSRLAPLSNHQATQAAPMLPTPARTSPAKHVSSAPTPSGTCAISSGPEPVDLFALAPGFPTSSPLADRVRVAKPVRGSIPRPLSLRSRLRRARLSAPAR